MTERVKQVVFRSRRRRGATLLLCLMTAAITSIALLGILNGITAELTAARHSADYERALYLAGAGVHEALAELEADPTFAGPVTATEYPSGGSDTYSATLTPGANNTITIVGEGTAANVTRRVQAVVQTNG